MKLILEIDTNRDGVCPCCADKYGHGFECIMTGDFCRGNLDDRPAGCPLEENSDG